MSVGLKRSWHGVEGWGGTLYTKGIVLQTGGVVEAETTRSVEFEDAAEGACGEKESGQWYRSHRFRGDSRTRHERTCRPLPACESQCRSGTGVRVDSVVILHLSVRGRFGRRCANVLGGTRGKDSRRTGRHHRPIRCPWVRSVRPRGPGGSALGAGFGTDWRENRNGECA